MSINNAEIKQGTSLTAINLHKTYETRVILNNESVSINNGDRVALVGRNGSGKTTLLKILNGIEKPNSGTVNNQNVRIGYLPQDMYLEGDRTIYDVVSESISSVVNALKHYNSMINDYHADDPRFIEEVSKYQEYLENTDGFRIEDNFKEILRKLGIDKNMNTQLKNLSGGERIRTVLAKILIGKPSILLLDEPTNYLDFEVNLWLREYLKAWQGGMLIASHDRDFINDVCNKTLEIDSGKLRIYGGSFDFYIEQKSVIDEAKRKEFIRLKKQVGDAKQQVNIEQEKAAHSARRDLTKKPEDHDRARAHFFKERATKTSGTNRRKKNLRVEELEATLSLNKVVEISDINLNIFEADTHKGKNIIKFVDLVIGYEGILVNGVNLNINFGDKIAIFGKNGSGKSTLLESIIKPDNAIIGGNIERSSGSTVELIDQNYTSINRDMSVLDNLRRVARNMNDVQIRKHLAYFMYRETRDVQKKAGILSGGELMRLALGMAVSKPLDILILDEPTNNLDISSIQEMEKAVKSFRGAVLVVSHDLTFIRNINVDKACIINNNSLIELKTSPSDNEKFKEELRKYL